MARRPSSITHCTHSSHRPSVSNHSSLVISHASPIITFESLTSGHSSPHYGSTRSRHFQPSSHRHPPLHSSSHHCRSLLHSTRLSSRNTDPDGWGRRGCIGVSLLSLPPLTDLTRPGAVHRQRHHMTPSPSQLLTSSPVRAQATQSPLSARAHEESSNPVSERP